jgi:hypothetical protein
MVLGSTQPLTEIGTKNLLAGKERPARKADLIAICEPRRLTTLWASTGCYSDGFNNRNKRIQYDTVAIPRDSAVGTATGYELDDRGVGIRVPVGAKLFSSPQHLDRLKVPPSFLSNGYRGLFPRGERGRGVKLTSHLQLEPRSKNVNLYIQSPIRLHGAVLN